MLLVLGRPGAGCTTLLKVLANRRTGFADVDGDVHFGSLRQSWYWMDQTSSDLGTGPPVLIWELVQ